VGIDAGAEALSVITAGQLRSAVGALQGIDANALQGAISSNLSNLADDAIVAEDVLGIIAIFFPAAGIIAALIALLVEVQPFLSIDIKPGSPGEGQTDEGRGGRRG
jgi:hypothetical protein